MDTVHLMSRRVVGWLLVGSSLLAAGAAGADAVSPLLLAAAAISMVAGVILLM